MDWQDLEGLVRHGLGVPRVVAHICAVGRRSFLGGGGIAEKDAAEKVAIKSSATERNATSEGQLLFQVGYPSFFLTPTGHYLTPLVGINSLGFRGPISGFARWDL